MIDTSVLAAGIAGFKPGHLAENASARFLREWLENGTFTWLLSREILVEYKEVLRRLGVRRTLIGSIVNLLREEAEFLDVRSSEAISPDPDDDAFCACAEAGQASFIATLNVKHFPQRKLVARVIAPGDPIPTTRRRQRDKG